MKGVTKTGFEIEIDDAKIDDIRVVDALVDIEEGDLGGVSKAIRLLFTPEQKKSFYDHLQKEYGSMKIEITAKEFFELINNGGETKNL